MSVNTLASTFRRTAADEAEDAKQIQNNILAQSWKSWPNHAAFVGLNENLGPIPLNVKGTIPAWAAGSLYRTGPGMSQVETNTRGTHYVSHWFDGFAHSHKFDIIAPSSADGSTTVTYTSRRQSDDIVAEIKKKGFNGSITFAQKADPCIGMFSKAMSAFKPNKNGAINVNVTVMPNYPGLSKRRTKSKDVNSGGHRTKVESMFLGVDTTVLQEIDPETLEPLGRTDQKVLHPELKGHMSCAHAQRDPETGDWFNYNLEFGRIAKYRIFRTNAETGTTDILATVSDSSIQPAYIHSFFLTNNYLVLCIPTTHFGLSGMQIPWENNLLDAIKPFDKSTRAQWIVVDRRHGNGVVGRFSTPAGFFFHSINAFEEVVTDKEDQSHTEICLDYVHYDTLDVMSSVYYDIILDRKDATAKHWIQDEKYKTNFSRLVRYRYRMPSTKNTNGTSQRPSPNISNKPGNAKEDISIPGPHIGELPSINPEYACKPYRYVYTCSTRGLSTLNDCISKTDLKTRDTVFWSGPEGHSPGEPIFIPRPQPESASGATNGDSKVSEEKAQQPLDEDDGVLLSVVLDGKAEKSYLLCLDARTMEETGRAEVDFALGMGIHGHHAAAL